MLEQRIRALDKSHICSEEGALEAYPLDQQAISEMLPDAWLNAYL